MATDTKRALTSEALGTALLVATVVGSGIMGEQLAGGNVAIALLANTAATGAVLIALIASLGPISGAHLNPAVTLTAWMGGELQGSDAVGYVAAQLVGGVGGTLLAHAMFALPLVSLSQHARAGGAQWLSEFVATFGLVVVIQTNARHRPDALPWAVAAWIVAGYWFTASTSFANPAVTLARTVTDSFAGIRPVDAPAFIAAQLLAAAAASALTAWLIPTTAPSGAKTEEKVPLRRAIG